MAVKCLWNQCPFLEAYVHNNIIIILYIISYFSRKIFMHDPECHTGVKSSCLWTQIWRQFWDLDQGSEDRTMDGRFLKARFLITPVDPWPFHGALIQTHIIIYHWYILINLSTNQWAEFDFFFSSGDQSTLRYTDLILTS